MSVSPNQSPSKNEPEKPFFQDLVGDDRFYEIVESKLEDPNMVCELGYTLLHIASWSLKANPKIVNLLLQRGADVNSATEHGYTPLHFAVASRKRYAVAAFIKAGADLNKGSYRTALHISIGSRWTFPSVPALNLPCDMWIVKRLLNHPKIDINPKDVSGSTPLMWAVHTRNSFAVKELLKKGANPNISNLSGRTPLHRALSFQNPNFLIVEPLLRNGADIYCVDKLGNNTPIDVFVKNVKKNNTLLFAKRVVWLIALLYRIEDSLKLKLTQIPKLSEHFEKCHKEVRLMNSQVIYDKFTLHDFALNCYQTRFFDNNKDTSTPVISLLLSGNYVQYINFMMDRV